MRRLPPVLAFACLLAGVLTLPRSLVSRPSVGPDFVHFESGHVHPACLTPDGTRLLVVNTADSRLAVFDLTGALPVRVAEVPVGLEPVSVACAGNNTAWVVNHLSDDVSIVDLTTLHVRSTLRVGDEPADVVFAGSPLRAFVSVSQEDAIKVFDAATSAPVGTVAVPGRFPRALAVNPAGSRVYAAVFHAGNRTSVLSAVEANDSLPPPSPPMSGSLPPSPDVALIVQQQGADWRDESGKLWNSRVRYSVLDTDVAEIDAASASVLRTFGDIGTLNFGIAVNTAGDVAVSATEARNLVRFEPNLRGHTVDTRVARITVAGAKSLVDLNPHVDYTVSPGPQAERDSALGFPTAVAWSGVDRLYVTSLASDRLGVVTAGLTPQVIARVPTVPGPTGVVVDDVRGRVYVIGRHRNQLQTFAAGTLQSLAIATIGFDPTPDAIVNGRKFFYGGSTSGHGEQSCASCHAFGDMDNIAWDLGDPGGDYQPAPPGQTLGPILEGFHPMKGPMTTQTLRGLPGTGILHWRGDRADLTAFNGAFVGLLGRGSALPDSEMAAFSDFVLPLAYPPNPLQNLDRTQRNPAAPAASAERGRQFYMNTPVDGPLTCNGCHSVPTGTNGQIINDDALAEDQDVKVPQLRNMYRKTGFSDVPGAQNKRGFGFIHDGSVDNLFNFLLFPGFNFGTGATATQRRRDVEAFLLAFDTGTAPAVGRAITFHGANNGHAPTIAVMDTLQAQAAAGHCELIARARVQGQPRSFRYAGAGSWQPDKQAESQITSAALRALGGPGSEVTVMGVPVTTGTRMGVDRDRDGHRDGDELDAGSDPGNPASTPGNVAVDPSPGHDALSYVGPNPFRDAADVAFTLARAGRVDVTIHDLMGRTVKRPLHAAVLPAGPHRVRWNGDDASGSRVAPGVYFVRVSVGSTLWTRPLVRIR